MSQWTDMYRQKLMTPEEAVKVVQSGDWVDYGMGTTQPILLDQALAARRDELQDVKVRMCLRGRLLNRTRNARPLRP